MNNDNSVVNQLLLSQARQLVAELENGNQVAANNILDELTQIRETELFNEVGKLTRQVHDAMANFEIDQTIQSLSNHDITDAKERLHYVITMTNQAANRTLNAVEEALPSCDMLLDEAVRLNLAWQRFMRREMSVDDFRVISKDLGAFLDAAEQGVGQLKINLNEVLMAQEFQDITGQIINRVIKLVEEVEASLVNLVRITGGAKVKESETTTEVYLAGPQMPTRKSETAVSNQDEVDDLLSSLGF